MARRSMRTALSAHTGCTEFTLSSGMRATEALETTPDFLIASLYKNEGSYACRIATICVAAECLPATSVQAMRVMSTY
jgi:hypothetical protein